MYAIVYDIAEGKTDYAARRALVVQDKNKYAAPKYRLVVRLTNQYVICQVVSSEIDGDNVLASAYSSELKNYGLTVGLKNYAAAYCTGLLVARRVLTKLGLAETYTGNEEVDGKVVKTTHEGEGGKKKDFYVAEVSEDKKPFRVFLDVGIRATTTGARVFGAMKGAADGGLDIPHNEKRFPGYDRDAKKFDADEMKARIFGEHVQDYQNTIRDDDNEQYEKQFSKFLAAGVEPDDLPDLYAKVGITRSSRVHPRLSSESSPVARAPLLTFYRSCLQPEPIPQVHEEIRADPLKGVTSEKAAWSGDKTKFKKPVKGTNEDRKARVAEKKQNRIAQLQSAVGEEDDE